MQWKRRRRPVARWLVALDVFVLFLAGQLGFARSAAAQIHTSHDHIPDFSASSTITTATNGSWSNAATWSPARVPGPSDIVKIRHSVTYDSMTGDANVIGVEAGGTLRFVTGQSTRLRVGTLLVKPNGALEVGTPQTPIAVGAFAEIIIKSLALNLTADPDQYGTGLVVVDGSIKMNGAGKTSWLRLAAEPRAGNSTVTVEQPVIGWQPGDVLVIPDSREDPTRVTDAQLEKRTVQSVSADGRTITLSSPLTYTHPGAKDHTGALVMLPHVMNLSRNVIIRSENPAGVRGHTLHTNKAFIDIRYAEFRDLGRTTISVLSNSTNHIGRYALHLHHVIGQSQPNGYQYNVIGNAIHDTNTARSRIKWPLAIHNSHYGLIQGNAIYNAGGAGLVTEDGNESYNLIESNFVARVTGNGDRQGIKEGGVQEAGSQGAALWFHGINNYVRNNVGANANESTDEAGYGLEIYQERLGDIRIPNFKGADTSVSGQYTVRSAYSLPILEFSGNEAYGNPQGITYWWVGAEWHTAVSTASSVFKDLRLWHNSRYPLYAYHGNRIVFDGMRIYGDPGNTGSGRTAWFGDYRNFNTIIMRSTIVGIGSLTLPYATIGTTLVQDSFVATFIGIRVVTSGAPGDGPGNTFPNRAQIIRNVRFAALPGRSLRTITMDFEEHGGSGDPNSLDRTFVYNYQGQAGNDFRVYYKEQATQNIAGGLAPCTNTTARPEIDGITCPMSGTPPPEPPMPTSSTPPTAPTNLRIITQ